MNYRCSSVVGQISPFPLNPDIIVLSFRRPVPKLLKVNLTYNLYGIRHRNVQENTQFLTQINTSGSDR